MLQLAAFTPSAAKEPATIEMPATAATVQLSRNRESLANPCQN